MSQRKKIEWLLRVGVAGEFIGHGLLAIEGKKDWIGWISQMIHVSTPTANHAPAHWHRRCSYGVDRPVSACACLVALDGYLGILDSTRETVGWRWLAGLY